MPSINLINNLNRKTQIEIAIELIEVGLSILTKYNSENLIKYSDSIVGAYHKIDKYLIEKSIRLLKKVNGRNNFVEVF